MKRIVFSLLAFALAGLPALAQQPVRASSTNAASTIAVTNTFQSVFAASAARLSCSVQNTGTNPMYVFFGAIAAATNATSVKLTAGQSTTCTIGGVVVVDQVSITGTATETFYAAAQ